MVSTRLPLFIMYIIRDLMSRVIAYRAATHSLPQMVPTSSKRIDDFKRNQPRILAALEPWAGINQRLSVFTNSTLPTVADGVTMTARDFRFA